MLSSVFVDRPRLAIVISIVTTIAGALALYTIPIAQYPDIVPPQVSVTTNFPGASAAVVVTSTVSTPATVPLMPRKMAMAVFAHGRGRRLHHDAFGKEDKTRRTKTNARFRGAPGPCATPGIGHEQIGFGLLDFVENAGEIGGALWQSR
jgi:hypothetical protein